MIRVSGLVYGKGTFQTGYVELGEDGNRFHEGACEDPVTEGLIIPRFINCHTHLGDAFIPRPDEGSVEELVAPPNGLKHRMMREVSEEEQVGAMRQAIMFMVSSGTSAFLDFREGGVEGARRLLKASMGLNIRPVIFGRPLGMIYDKNEMDSLLHIVDGIGLSAINDWDHEEILSISEHTRAAGKPFALHASEAVREDIDSIIGLKPSFLVHMTKAAPEDLKVCADNNIPIVICPGSNEFFGLEPPVKEMRGAGVTVCLGTDNAMISKPDMLAELGKLRSMFSKDDVPDSYLLELMFDNSRKTLNSILGLGGEDPEYPEFLVLDSSQDDPIQGLLDADLEDVILIQDRQKEW